MPTKIDATKSKMRSKSSRKPLRDVSNAKVSVKPPNNSKKNIPEEDGGKTGGNSLDCLLLVHSDISSLLRQIDELVVQALQLTGDKGRKEIKKFADLLSDMRTSLKPWIPKFQNVITSGSDENTSKQSADKTATRKPKESTEAIIESPEESQRESLISPSPLVSWRAEWKTEGGRQLFLLTPLPQTMTKTKKFSSKLQASSIPGMEEAVHPVSLFDSVGNMGTDLPESALAKTSANKAVETLEDISTSPPTSSKMDCSMIVMTPCLKMSPPKSCILLEPASMFSKKHPGDQKSTPYPLPKYSKKHSEDHKSTPYPAAVRNSDSFDSESSSGGNQSSDDLKVKYPELFGINTNTMGSKKVAENSPNWIVSPPKTCVIMEPPDEKSSKNQPAFDLVESTPMIKEVASNFRVGKHPGENTLKRELWTKFEAASSNTIVRFESSILHATTRKGFLEQLEEASDA
ncbi:uncharacterized protein LOC127254766 [Andrographis paniculata]|uniref:uncharacterized protein LOC127254766 n=1 Tax=Andrographis paniculata TaxID=175694 RepID=UPI0021E7C692|nr:uncharacterized protein LOC127254766 [Andrographis paniculata]XP_051135996.1 uncharacterized protein LOC127254766 [Andrographis paniculata]